MAVSGVVVDAISGVRGEASIWYDEVTCSSRAPPREKLESLWPSFLGDNEFLTVMSDHDFCELSAIEIVNCVLEVLRDVQGLTR
jgi:hypothetical protein